MKWFSSLYYFFPFRLFLQHFKSNLLLIGAWLILGLFITKQIGADYGVPYLFLDPEYLGVVGYFSFQLVGTCFGLFFIVWNVATYLLYSHKYPFIASMKWPVAMFTLNNVILPLAFIAIYVKEIIAYQTVEMLKDPVQVTWSILGFFAGFLFVLLVVSLYFIATNKNVFGYIKDEKQSFKSETDIWYDLSGSGKGDAPRVDYYFTKSFRIRPVRSVVHYSDQLLKRVFRQHHINAFILSVLVFGLLLGLGFLIDKPIFEIPAAGSMFLFFAMLVSLAAFLYYWANEWGTFAFFVFILVINFITGFDYFNYDNHAYGINYDTKPTTYDLESLQSLAATENVEADMDKTIAILENWKKIASQDQPYWYKPKMIVVISSGGGSRAATFTMNVLQTADSLTNGAFMQNTTMMSGASGGMLGIGYFRELYLRKHLGVCGDLYSKKYQLNIAKDLVNKLTTSVVTNDVYYPFQTRNINGYDYVLDRGMMMEYALNENTEGVLDKPISDYKFFEKNASIPLLFTACTNVADSRKLIISPQPISYMMRAFSPNNDAIDYEVDAIDFGALFQNHSPYNLRFSSALRMNATYPMILPNVSLPSDPKIDVIDAGLRDNYGMEMAARFVNVFHEWINENTSGVVIVQIRGLEKHNAIDSYEYQSFFSKMFGAMGNLQGNISVTQDYLQDYMLDATSELLNDNLEVVRFELRNNETDIQIPLSMHLTNKQIEMVMQEAQNERNQASFLRLQEILE